MSLYNMMFGVKPATFFALPLLGDVDKTGGPAFPADHGSTWPGLSMRDWFAGQAGAKLCTEVDMDDNWQLIAQRSYAFADAMVAERSKGGAS